MHGAIFAYGVALVDNSLAPAARRSLRRRGPLRVHAHARAAPRRRRHRLAREPDRAVLVRRSGFCHRAMKHERGRRKKRGAPPSLQPTTCYNLLRSRRPGSRTAASAGREVHPRPGRAPVAQAAVGAAARAGAAAAARPPLPPPPIEPLPPRRSRGRRPTAATAAATARRRRHRRRRRDRHGRRRRRRPPRSPPRPPRSPPSRGGRRSRSACCRATTAAASVSPASTARRERLMRPIESISVTITCTSSPMLHDVLDASARGSPPAPRCGRGRPCPARSRRTRRSS